MADAAILIRWNRVVPGREQQALSLFGQSLEYYGTLASEGAIDSYEPVMLNPSGGDLNGFILLRGSADQLDAVKREDRFIDIMMRAAHNCEGLGVNDAFLEGELQARMSKWAQIIAQ
ncbi:MAG: hypothetical protein ACN4G0_02480 [Polyangiales bacterium]